jgi:uncharacterized protein
MELRFYLLCFFIFVSYTTEALTGFGCIIIAVALGANFYPIPEILPLVVPLNLILSLYFVIRYFKLIDKILIFKVILPIMGCGTLLGYYLIQFIQGDVLRIVFGVSVILFAGREIFKFYRNRENNHKMPLISQFFWIFSSGVIHGIYGSGGPMLVYAISGNSQNKGVFRATLSAIWFSMNLLLTVIFVYHKQINEDNISTLLIMIPIVLLGIVLGELLHHRINEEKFKLVVYWLLLVSGLSLLR